MIDNLPNLYIPGAAKSGTSTLHELLNFHLKINMSSVKEPHFWAESRFNEYTKEDYNNYFKLFDKESNAKYYAESSTGYMIFPSFMENIMTSKTKQLKFIFILRNPIDRTYSHYWWLKGIGSEKLNLKDAILNDFDIEPKRDDKLPEGNYKYYYQFGLYYKWIKKFYNNFNEDNIKIITYENLKTDRLKTINECFEFLGLEKLEGIPNIQSNKTQILKFPYLFKWAKKIAFNKAKVPKFIKIIIPKKVKQYIRIHIYNFVMKLTKTNKRYPKLNIEDRDWLKSIYKDDVQQLKKMTGLSFKEWIDFNTH